MLLIVFTTSGLVFGVRGLGVKNSGWGWVIWSVLATLR